MCTLDVAWPCPHVMEMLIFVWYGQQMDMQCPHTCQLVNTTTLLHTTTCGVQLLSFASHIQHQVSAVDISLTAIKHASKLPQPASVHAHMRPLHTHRRHASPECVLTCTHHMCCAIICVTACLCHFAWCWPCPGHT